MDAACSEQNFSLSKLTKKANRKTGCGTFSHLPNVSFSYRAFLTRKKSRQVSQTPCVRPI